MGAGVAEATNARGLRAVHYDAAPVVVTELDDRARVLTVLNPVASSARNYGVVSTFTR